MKKYTKRQIKELVELGKATDITSISFDDAQELRRKEGHLEELGYALGTYGTVGKVLQGDNTKTLYAICERTSAVFMF